jgi:hypothetical protein
MMVDYHKDEEADGHRPLALLTSSTPASIAIPVTSLMSRLFVSLVGDARGTLSLPFCWGTTCGYNETGVKRARKEAGNATTTEVTRGVSALCHT